MNKENKLFLVILTIIVISLVSWTLYGEETFQKVFSVLLFVAALVNFVIFLRTRILGYLILALFSLFTALTFFALSIHDRLLVLFFAVPAGIALILHFYMLFSKKDSK